MQMNTIKKALAGLAIVGMTLTMGPVQVFADTGVTSDRLAGEDRIGTAVAVAKAGWTTADTVIIAPSADENLVDSLAAAPLAGKTMPILLTEKDRLNGVTAAELVKLGTTKAYVVGAIDQAVVGQLDAIGVTPTVLKGADRIATATAIAGKLTDPAGSFVVGYGALVDALSVASFAAANNYSILVANQDGTLPASEAALLGDKVTIIGGPTLVKDISGATRYFGADRFVTNKLVLEAFTYQYDHVYIANGQNGHLVDSLVASSLAAKSGAPIVLSELTGSVAVDTIHAKLAADAIVTALGGTGVVPDAVVSLVVTGSPSEAATAAVSKAEDSKLQADVDAAQALVTTLPAGTVKDDLQGRLDAVQKAINYETAAAAVSKAEDSKLQADVDAAQVLVTALPAGTAKDDLQGRLAAVQAVIDYEAAEAAVAQAESSKLQAEVDAAQTLVTALPDGTAKDDLQARLNAIVVE
jgi:putative cell wall-binding protein